MLTGKTIKRLMRKHRCTIRELKKRTGITLKRIREVRETGLDDEKTARDWIEAITGKDPGMVWFREGGFYCERNEVL